MIARQPGAVIGGTNATYGLGGMPATTREAGIPVDPSIYDDHDEKFDNEVCIRIPYPCIVVTLHIFFSMCLFSVEKKTPRFCTGARTYLSIQCPTLKNEDESMATNMLTDDANCLMTTNS